MFTQTCRKTHTKEPHYLPLITFRYDFITSFREFNIKIECELLYQQYILYLVCSSFVYCRQERFLIVEHQHTPPKCYPGQPIPTTFLLKCCFMNAYMLSNYKSISLVSTKHALVFPTRTSNVPALSDSSVITSFRHTH